MTKKVKLAVLGNPVAHSRSPEIHEMFAKQCGKEIVYGKIEVPLGEFLDTIDDLIGQHYCGVNVTIPFKIDAYRCAGKCTSRARQSQAANTLKFEGSKVLADNTDGEGFVRDVKERLGYKLQGKRVLFLGAGGAVRGILPSLLDEMPRSVTVANRSLARAQELQEEFGIQNILYDEIDSENYEVIINATPASLQNKAPLIHSEAFESCDVAYDLVYAPKATPFMQMATDAGVKIATDGLGMLVEQAASSFEFWLGVRPQTPEVYKAICELIEKEGH